MFRHCCVILRELVFNTRTLPSHTSISNAAAASLQLSRPVWSAIYTDFNAAVFLSQLLGFTYFVTPNGCIIIQ